MDYIQQAKSQMDFYNSFKDDTVIRDIFQKQIIMSLQNR